MMTKTSEELKKLAQEIRTLSNKIKVDKTIKCAKLMVGATSLMHLKNKLTKRS